MLNSVEEFRQVNIRGEAVSASDDAAYLLGGSVSRTLGPKAEARLAEMRIKHRRQDLDDGSSLFFMVRSFLPRLVFEGQYYDLG